MPGTHRHRSVAPPGDSRRARELCKVCDTDKPAAAAVIGFFTSGGGHDLSRAEEGSRLMIEWTREGMAAHGWHWEETPRGHHWTPRQTAGPAGRD
ncbi:DUF6300 family protein [Streptomyces sp. NBC_00414]|uniref:DUF6300 family protein n=1 Tax=Streptomyces sp. NBC_00414 TaxID=2975739 RepID=UPI003FA7AFE0